MSASNSSPVPPLGRRSPSPDVTAADGSEIRLLVDSRQGAVKSSLVEVTLGPGEITRPVWHRTVEEVWYVLEGAGTVWRCPAGRRSGERFTRGSGPWRRLSDPHRLAVPVQR